jgi:hypothetical protein
LFFTVSFGSFEPCNGDDDADDMDDADADDDDDNDDELIRFQSDCPSPLEDLHGSVGDEQFPR